MTMFRAKRGSRLSTIRDHVRVLPKDSVALTFNGSTRWPTAKELRKLGETRAGGTPAKIRQNLERIAEAIQEDARR